MKSLFFALALIWAVPLCSMEEQPPSTHQIELIQIKDNDGSLYTVDPSDVDASAVQIGYTAQVGYDDPRSGEHKRVTGTIIAIKYEKQQ